MLVKEATGIKWIINTLRPRQDGRLFPDDIFKSIFVNENAQILIKLSLTFVPKAPINNIPALVQIMVWRRPGDKTLSEPMMVSLLTHICVTRPQWVNLVMQAINDIGYSRLSTNRARFLPFACSKLGLCSVNHRAGYLGNLACDCRA